MRDKKHKVKKVKCKRNESTAKELIFLEYNNILQKKKHLSFAQNFAIIDQGKQDYKVNYVNTDLHHQYGIFAFFKVQTCLPRNVPIGEEREEMAANISVQRKSVCDKRRLQTCRPADLQTSRLADLLFL